MHLITMNLYFKLPDNAQRNLRSGFTIVELIVVIVVIAILAAITVVTFNGIQQRAADSALRSDIANTQRLVATYHATEGTYPLAEGAVNNGQGFISSVDTTYEYTSDGAVFCLTATSQKAKKSYFINSDNSSPTDGACPGDTGYVAGPVAAKDEWLAVSATGSAHACGIGTDQKAYCWGSNSNGQLGDGTTTSSNTPIAVLQGAMPAGATIAAISTGNYTTCAVASDNNVYCWGISGSGPQWVNSTTPTAIARGAIPTGASIKKIDIDGGANCVLTGAGSVYCWGDNSLGTFGNGTTTNSATPVAIHQGAIPDGVTIKDMDTGNYSVCAIGSDDHVYCWGSNGAGQLGDGTQTSRSLPVAVLQGAMPASGQLNTISVGSSSVCTIMAGLRAYCWGAGGRTGDGTNTRRTSPVQIYQTNGMGTGETRAISVGYQHTCSSDSAGALYCWGSSAYGEASPGTRPSKFSSLGEIPSSGTIEVLSAGNTVTCAIDNARKLYCWGSNQHGKLGVGSTASSVTTPTEVAARP